MSDTDSGGYRHGLIPYDDINIQFPTELIPDEYEHENGTNGLVYLFQDDDGKLLADKLLESLKHSGYNVPPQNIFSATDINTVIDQLSDLATNDFTPKTCLLVVIIAKTNIFENLLVRNVATKIWSPFIENSTLKFKPKIFMFYQYEERVYITYDGSETISAIKEPYDVPSEADVLIVYQKSIVNKSDKYGFLGQFSEHLKNYGKRDDIMGLLVRTQHEARPLIISTLRKQFYITSSNTREHYFDIQTNSEKVLEIIDSLKIRMQKIGRDLPKRSLLHNSISVDKGANKPTQASSTLKKNRTVPDNLNSSRTSSRSASMASTKGSIPNRGRWQN